MSDVLEGLFVLADCDWIKSDLIIGAESGLLRQQMNQVRSDGVVFGKSRQINVFDGGACPDDEAVVSGVFVSKRL